MTMPPDRSWMDADMGDLADLHEMQDGLCTVYAPGSVVTVFCSHCRTQVAFAIGEQGQCQCREWRLGLTMLYRPSALVLATK